MSDVLKYPMFAFSDEGSRCKWMVVRLIFQNLRTTPKTMLIFLRSAFSVANLHARPHLEMYSTRFYGRKWICASTFTPASALPCQLASRASFVHASLRRRLGSLQAVLHFLASVQRPAFKGRRVCGAVSRSSDGIYGEPRPGARLLTLQP